MCRGFYRENALHIIHYQQYIRKRQREKAWNVPVLCQGVRQTRFQSVWVPQSGLLEVCERVVNLNFAWGNVFVFCSTFDGVAALDLQGVQIATPFQVHSRHL